MAVAACALVLGVATYAGAETVEWTGAGGNNAWGTPENWTPTPAWDGTHGAIIGGAFAGTSIQVGMIATSAFITTTSYLNELGEITTTDYVITTSSFLSATYAINSLVIDTTAAMLNIYRGGLILDGGITRLNTGGFTGTQMISSSMSLTQVAQWQIEGERPLAVYGAISGSGGIVKTGSGTLHLSGSNTFTGGVSVMDGTLRISGYCNGITTSNVFTLKSGPLGLGTLSVCNASLISMGGVTISNPVELSGAVTVGGTYPMTFSRAPVTICGSTDLTVTASSAAMMGFLTGSGNLNKLGPGILNLAGSSNGLVNVDVHEGALMVSSSSALGAVGTAIPGGTITVYSGAKLIANGYNARATTDMRDGSMFCLNYGQWLSPLTLNGAMTIAAYASSGGSMNGQITGSGSLIIDIYGAGLPTGTGGMTGTRSLSINGTNNNYTGGTTIRDTRNGFVNVSAPGGTSAALVLGTGPVAVDAGATVCLNLMAPNALCNEIFWSGRLLRGMATIGSTAAPATVWLSGDLNIEETSTSGFTFRSPVVALGGPRNINVTMTPGCPYLGTVAFYNTVSLGGGMISVSGATVAIRGTSPNPLGDAVVVVGSRGVFSQETPTTLVGTVRLMGGKFNGAQGTFDGTLVLAGTRNEMSANTSFTFAGDIIEEGGPRTLTLVSGTVIVSATSGGLSCSRLDVAGASLVVRNGAVLNVGTLNVQSAGRVRTESPGCLPATGVTVDAGGMIDLAAAQSSNIQVLPGGAIKGTGLSYGPGLIELQAGAIIEGSSRAPSREVVASLGSGENFGIYYGLTASGSANLTVGDDGLSTIYRGVAAISNVTFRGTLTATGDGTIALYAQNNMTMSVSGASLNGPGPLKLDGGGTITFLGGNNIACTNIVKLGAGTVKVAGSGLITQNMNILGGALDLDRHDGFQGIANIASGGALVLDIGISQGTYNIAAGGALYCSGSSKPSGSGVATFTMQRGSQFVMPTGTLNWLPAGAGYDLLVNGGQSMSTIITQPLLLTDDVRLMTCANTGTPMNYGSLGYAGSAYVGLADGQTTLRMAALQDMPLNISARVVVSGSDQRVVIGGTETISAINYTGRGGFIEATMTGTVRLTNSSNIIRQIDLLSGALYVNGQVLGDVRVVKGTRFGGSARVFGRVVVVGGDLAPGNSPGEMTLDQDLAFEPDPSGSASNFDTEIDFVSGSIACDRTTVAGNVTGLEYADLNILIGETVTLDDVSGQTFTILSAANDLTGQSFHSINWTPGWWGTVDFVGNTVQVTVAPTVDASEIPEPATMAMLALGAVALLRRRSGRRAC
jgi:autotransporter-associated beta strand protein